MENTIVSGSKRTFRVALFGVAMLVFGGTALAATAPTVAPLRFEYTAKDANGNTVTLENKITTGYEANRVAVDASGNVYVTDAVSNTVKVFNTNGRLVRQININRPDAIGIDDQNDRIYISGAVDGRLRSIWTFDKNGDGKGPLSQFPWGTPSAITVGSSGDVYVADGDLNTVRRLSPRGESERKVYGPFGGERYAKEQYLQSNVTVDVYRTRRRMVAPQGVAVDEAKGLLYVAVKEVTEYLDKSCLTTTLTVDGTTSSDPACYIDNENSWGYYANLAELTSLGKTTDSSYKYWNPVPYTIPVSPTPPPIQYLILVIDINKGNNDVNNSGYIEKTELKKIITINSLNPYGTDPTFYYPWQPKGVALDGNGRLYIAAYTSDAGTRNSSFGTFYGGIKVYDVDPDANGLIKGTALTPSGSFTSAVYVDVVYSPNLNANGTPATGGRLFAAAGGSKTVSSYGIDGGTNPANTAPGKPILLDPVNSAAVNTSTPTLRIRNSTDAENDPLAYSYEICSGSCTASVPVKVASAAGITGGVNNETTMTVTQKLDDSLCHWRAQSFDGEKAAWSDEATFCVDEVNSIPTKPEVISPVSGVVSPFGSRLSWNASTDSDCTNDTVTYEVTVSDSQGNIVKSFSGLGATSINVSDISGLTSGNTYNWTVRAVDNKGGKSDYSTGSFTYITTKVKFDSDQPETKVYIDGNYGYSGKLLNGKYDESGKLVGIKSLPIEIQDLTPGSHFVSFINAGYEPFNVIVKIPDPLSVDGKVAVVINGKDIYVDDSKVVASMVKASKIRPSSSEVELVKINGGNAAPFMVDYNDDGLKDIIAGGKVNVYNGSGQLIDVIDGKVYLFLAQEQLQGDGTKKVVLIDSGAIQADGSDINAGSKAVPFVVDFNNDGKKDLLVGSGDGLIYLYENSGTDSVPAFASAGTLKDSSGGDIKVSNSAPVVVDYNNDGRKDLVVGGFDGKLRLYKNAGTDASPKYDPIYETIKADNPNSDLSVGSNSKAFFTDWNSDGKNDLVVGDGSGKASLFFNVGNDDAPEFKSITGLQQWIKEKKKERGNRDYIKYLGYNQDIGDLAGGSGEASPFVVDWEGTSARDLIVGNGSGGVAAYVTE